MRAACARKNGLKERRRGPRTHNIRQGREGGGLALARHGEEMEGRKEGRMAMLMKQRQVACALFVCVIRFAQSCPATRRRCRRRLNNRLSRLRNQHHARKEGRNRISSWFMRPPRRPSLYSPTLRFRAFIRRRLPPASFLRSFSRSLPLRPAFRPSVRPSVVPITAPALPSRHASAHSIMAKPRGTHPPSVRRTAGPILNGSLSPFNAEKEHRSEGRKKTRLAGLEEREGRYGACDARAPGRG